MKSRAWTGPTAQSKEISVSSGLQIVAFFVNPSDTGSVQTKGVEHVYGKLTVVFRLTRPSHKRITLMVLCAVQIGTKKQLFCSFFQEGLESLGESQDLYYLHLFYLLITYFILLFLFIDY